MYAGTMALVPDGFKSGVYSADGEAALQFTFIYVTKNVTHPVLKINGQAARPLPGTARGGHAFDAPHRVREKLGAGTLFARNATTVEFVAKEDGAATAFSFSFDERRGHVAASVAALNDDLLEWLDHAMRHLDADPGETRNLAADPTMADTLAEHRRLLAAWQADTGDNRAPYCHRWVLRGVLIEYN